MFLGDSVAECMRPCKEGISIDLEVTPNSSESCIVGVDQWRNRFKVKVKSKPERGGANQELMKMFRDLLGVRSGDIVITSGHTTSQKTLQIKGKTEEEVLPIFKAAFGNED